MTEYSVVMHKRHVSAWSPSRSGLQLPDFNYGGLGSRNCSEDVTSLNWPPSVHEHAVTGKTNDNILDSEVVLRPGIPCGTGVGTTLTGRYMNLQAF